MRSFGGTVHRVAMAHAHAGALIDRVEMGIYLQDVDVAAVFECGHARDIDRMVAADNQRQGAGIDEADRSRQISGIVFMDIGAGMTDREERACLAYRAWSETRAGSKLRAGVEGGTENRGLGRYRAPFVHMRPLAEGSDAHEKQVESPRFIPVSGHDTLFPAAPSARRWLGMPAGQGDNRPFPPAASVR